MSFLRVVGLEKRFGETVVLEGVDLEAGEGEILALLGPSGSGKTTILRTVAGFESADAGQVIVGGEDVAALPPSRRRFGMVFQHFALFPHLNVAGNIRFGLTDLPEPSDREDRIAEVLELVDLAGYQNRRVDQLSGGQQQRVALARALAPRPRILLLDEPLSNLDPTLRERTRLQIRDAVRSVGITALWVTHEQEEAFTVGDRVAVLNRGRLEQSGAPEELYEEPATRFVAFFVGRASSVYGVAVGADEVRIGPESEGKHWRGRPVEELVVGSLVDIVMRPEHLTLGLNENVADALSGVVTWRRYGGSTTHFGVELDGLGQVEVSAASDSATVGDRVHVRLRSEAALPWLYQRTSE